MKRSTLDVYEGEPKPKYRIRLAEGASLAGLDLSGSWVVVQTEDGGEVAVALTVATRLVIRERTDADEADYAAKVSQWASS